MFPVPLAEAATFDPRSLGAHGARGRARDGGRRPRDDVRADAGRLPRPALGPNGGRSGRRSVARRADCARESARLSGRRPRVRRVGGRDGEALLRVRRRRRRGASTRRSTFPSARCARCICRPSRRPLRAGAAAIMPAFTDLAGIPMTAHKALLRDYLRGELGFDGVLVSDYNAIRELIASRRGGATSSRPPCSR